MSGLPNLPAQPVESSWVRATLAAVAAAMLLLALLFIYEGSKDWDTVGILALLELPYAALFLALFSRPRKLALGLAQVLALVVALPTLLLLVLGVIELQRRWQRTTPDFTILAYVAAFFLIHATLAVCAYKAYNAFYPEAGPRPRAKRLVYPLVAAVLLLVALAQIIPHWTDEHPPYESMAVGGLRTINTAAITYFTTYENGFPPSLAAMGSPPSGTEYDCRAAGLVDEVLASGQKSSYVFTYTPGPRVDKPAPGCPPGVKSYTATARPLKYGQTGQRSFYTDDSGVIRSTLEDRPATANDPPLN